MSLTTELQQSITEAMPPATKRAATTASAAVPAAATQLRPLTLCVYAYPNILTWGADVLQAMAECTGKNKQAVLSQYRDLRTVKDGARLVRYEYARGAHSGRRITQCVSQQEFSGTLCGCSAPARTTTLTLSTATIESSINC
jgi:hypothetical protein